MATLRVNYKDGKVSEMNFINVPQAGFKIPADATLSLEDHFETGGFQADVLKRYMTPLVFHSGTSVGSIQSKYRTSIWRLRVFVESKRHDDLIRCYDAIRAELGGETVVVADFPGNLCEALAALVTDSFAFVAGKFGELIGSNER